MWQQRRPQPYFVPSGSVAPRQQFIQTPVMPQQMQQQPMQMQQQPMQMQQQPMQMQQQPVMQQMPEPMPRMQRAEPQWREPPQTQSAQALFPPYTIFEPGTEHLKTLPKEYVLNRRAGQDTRGGYYEEFDLMVPQPPKAEQYRVVHQAPMVERLEHRSVSVPPQMPQMQQQEMHRVATFGNNYAPHGVEMQQSPPSPIPMFTQEQSCTHNHAQADQHYVACARLNCDCQQCNPRPCHCSKCVDDVCSECCPACVKVSNGVSGKSKREGGRRKKR